MFYVVIIVFFAKLEMSDGSVFGNAFINTRILILNIIIEYVMGHF
jgi:hypothetical protein